MLTITRNENGFGWGSLILSVLFFIASWTAFRNPVGTLVTLGVLFGSIALVQGILAIMFYTQLRKLISKPWPVLVIGILHVLIGFYLVINPSMSLTFFPFLLASWFLIDSVMNIMIAFRLRKQSPKWFWVHIILGIIGIVLGIFLASHLVIAMMSISMLIALYFLLTAIIKLIDAFV